MANIKIGNFEFDSTKLPKDGLDYSKCDEQTKKALSIFDTDNRKGHLSQKELGNAILYFSSYDGSKEIIGRYKQELITRFHKKDRKLDYYEKSQLREDYINKYVYNDEAQAKKLQELVKQAKKESWSKEKLAQELLNLEIEATKQILTAFANLNPYKNPLDTALKGLDMLLKASDKGYMPTNAGEKVFQSKDGKFYTFYDGKFHRADKNGNFKINISLNNKGQKASYNYDKDGNIVGVKALNYQNKVYTNEKYAASVLGMDKLSDKAAYNASNILHIAECLGHKVATSSHTFICKWHDKQHKFTFD